MATPLKAARLAAAPSGMSLSYGKVTTAPADATPGAVVGFVRIAAQSGGESLTTFWPRSSVLPAVGDRLVIADGPGVNAFIVSREA